MKRPHLLQVDDGPEAFAPLWEALRETGLRAGWLELAEPEPVPSTLVQAVRDGALRAVAVGEEGSVAVKRRKGPPVLGDLLREHFLGCRLVLVRGGLPAAGEKAGEGAEIPRLLAVSGGGWRVEVAGRAARDLSTEELATRLRRPRPWG